MKRVVHWSSRFSLVFLGLLWLFSLPTEVRAAVSVTLDRNEIDLGDSAQLTITSSGDNDNSVSPPTVPGLEFMAVGQSSQTQIIDGSITSTVSVIYEVVPQHAGTFTIPALAKGTAALVLKVSPAKGGANPSLSPEAQDAPNPSSTGGTKSSPPHLSPSGAAYLTLDLPKRELFVGETVPIVIQLGVLPGAIASLTDLPSLNGDSFALKQLSTKPVQDQEVMGNQVFTVLTWHSNLTALKPGEFPISVDIPLTIRVRAQRRPQIRNPDGSINQALNDPFFQDFFAETTEKQIKVSSDPESLKVLALPDEGRPADFNGAVGEFSVGSELSSPRGAVGDPLTLTLKISGSGDFDRVNSPMVGAGASWKTYQPTSKFNPVDAQGFRGEKDFQQAIIPLTPGPQTVPPISFSFFNPETRHYESKQTTSLPLEVTGNAISAPTPSPSNAVMTSSRAPDELRPDVVENGRTTSSLRPIYFQPWFLGLQAILILGFSVVGLGLQRHEKMMRGMVDPARETRVAVNQCLYEMDQAAAQRDSKRFFQFARAALQQKLARKWLVTPSSITSAEIQSHLGVGGESLQHLFTVADESAYSGQELTEADFVQWKEAVQRELNQCDSL